MFLVLGYAGHSWAQTCPARLEPLQSPFRPVVDRSIVPGEAEAERALLAIGRFEVGEELWGGISSHETISMGILQWNWESGSLQRLIAGMPEAAFQGIDETIAGEIRAVGRSLPGRPSAQARQAIERWTNIVRGTRSTRGIRADIRVQLRNFMESPAGQAHQRRIAFNEAVFPAYRVAVEWVRARARTRGVPEADALAARPSFGEFVFFVDNQVFNRGGLNGIWYHHVLALRSSLNHNVSLVVAPVVSWLRNCAPPMYGTDDAQRNADLWSILAESNQISLDQLDLFIAGFMRAQRSMGSNPGATISFPGIYQADVMNRRGTLAIGRGFVHGEEVRIE